MSANSKNDDYCLLLCTVPDKVNAEMLAKLALEHRLAACVTILPHATSYYVWEGKLEQQSELQLLFKTSHRHYDALMVLLKQHHPYQVPELLVLPVIAGDNEYLSWLNDCLN